MVYRYEWRVTVGQTDFSGRIHTPELVASLAKGLEKLMCDLGYSPKRAFEEGIVYPIVHTETEYLAPIVLNDQVSVAMDPSLGNTSMHVDTEGHVDNEKVFEGEITAAFIDDATSETVPVPEAVRRELSKFSGT